MDPVRLGEKLAEKTAGKALRRLTIPPEGADFFSNDYLGIVRDGLLEPFTGGRYYAHGSTGSRLLGGNAALTEETEGVIAAFHGSASALIFSSGYAANTGLLAAVARRGDTILYDQLIHASLRDGVRLSAATGYSFTHNDPAALERRLQKKQGDCFVVTESVFSMDGDTAPLLAIADCCSRYGAFLIVDEAHATGVAGAHGEGLVSFLGLQDSCFARVHTFGKALGCHGAAVLGSVTLRDYLINFCRPFIYSTALPPSAVAAIGVSYALFPGMDEARQTLRQRIARFRAAIHPGQPAASGPRELLSPVQVLVVPGNEPVRLAAEALRRQALAVFPILSPTVAEGGERIRFTIHSHNTEAEIERLVTAIRAL